MAKKISELTSLSSGAAVTTDEIEVSRSSSSSSFRMAFSALAVYIRGLATALTASALTVTSGTTAVQALTATTGLFTSSVQLTSLLATAAVSATTHFILLTNDTSIIKMTTSSASIANFARMTSADVFSVDESAFGVVFGGIVTIPTLKTGTFSGGAAEQWKLGSVNVVSPTSPNRTIAVSVGGTVYYLAAKTTNN